MPRVGRRGSAGDTHAAGSAQPKRRGSNVSDGDGAVKVTRRRFFTPIRHNRTVQQELAVEGGGSAGAGLGVNASATGSVASGAVDGNGDAGYKSSDSDDDGDGGTNAGPTTAASSGVDTAAVDPAVVNRFRSRTVLSDDGVEDRLESPPVPDAEGGNPDGVVPSGGDVGGGDVGTGDAADGLAEAEGDDEVVKDIAQTGFILWTTKVRWR